MIKSKSIEALLTVAKTYGGAEGLELSQVSWRSTQDSKKLSALESGADIHITRLEAMMRWFSDNWPAGTKWPKGIPRPAKTAAPVA